VLNLLQRMSGIATATNAMVQAAKPHKAKILGWPLLFALLNLFNMIIVIFMPLTFCLPG